MADKPDHAPDRRYQIFIGSTFTGLEHERKAAIEAVFKKGHIPIALERFSPTSQSDVEVIEQAIANSQVCIFILGHRYGEIMAGKNVSFCEYEYDLARKHKLLTLSFILDDETVRSKRDGADASKDPRDKADAPHEPRLKKFRDRVRAAGGASFRPSVGDEFRLSVLYALSEALRNYDCRGFIREPEDPTVIESARNEFIGDLVTELRGFEKLYDRTQTQSGKKRGASRFFVKKYIDRLLRHKVSLFFESGSTVAFVAKEMSERLKGKVQLDDNGSPSVQISTNNVLAYLLLWLRARIPCTNFPWSPPVEPKFGAAYGGLENIDEADPDYRQPPLDQIAQNEIKRLHKMDYSLSKMRRPVLLLGAVSGLQIGKVHRLKFKGDDEPDDATGHQDERLTLDEVEREQVAEEISLCFGPHVGSYHNKVFKRFMYDTRLPIMIFLTSDKIDCEIEVGKCHFILDREYRWEDFYKNHPLAFCVGCRRAERSRFVQMFKELGFAIVEEDSVSPVTSFIARNQAFDQAFEDKVDTDIKADKVRSSEARA